MRISQPNYEKSVGKGHLFEKAFEINLKPELEINLNLKAYVEFPPPPPPRHKL